MAKDLALTSSDYSLVLSIFFVAYLLFEVPSNMILAKSKPSIFLPTLMVIWVSGPTRSARTVIDSRVPSLSESREFTTLGE